jgi:hypothetical protein
MMNGMGKRKWALGIMVMGLFLILSSMGSQAWAKEDLKDYEGGYPDVYSIPNPSWPIDF